MGVVFLGGGFLVGWGIGELVQSRPWSGLVCIVAGAILTVIGNRERQR